MAISAIAKNFRDGTILIADGAALTYTVTYEDGDFKLDGLAQGLNEIAAYEDRGELFSLRLTKPAYPTFSFSAILTDVSSAAYATLVDACMKQNIWSAATSTTATTGDVYTLNVTITVAYSAESHVVAMTNCVLTVGIAEGDPDKVTVSGEVLGTVTMT